MKKEIQIAAKLDMGDFDRSIAEMQQKLKNLYTRAGQAGIGGQGFGPSAAAFQKSQYQGQGAADRELAKEVRAQEALTREILKKEDALKRALQQQKEVIKGSEQEKKLAEEIRTIKENTAKQQQLYKQRDMDLNKSMDVREQMRMAQTQAIRDRNPEGWDRVRRFSAQGMYGAAGREAFSNIGGMGGIARGAGTIMGAAGTMINVGAMVNEQMGKSPFRTSTNTGAAIEGTIDQTAQQMQTPYGQAWMSERVNAADMARRVNDITRNSDRLRLAGGTSMVGGGLISSLANASPFGAAASATGGIASMFGSERMRALSSSSILTGAGNVASGIGMTGTGNWLKGQGDQQMKEYNSILAKEFAQNFQTALDAEQKANPLKKLAAQSYSDNYTNYLQAQRGMGLNYDTFHGQGGYRAQQMKAGFTEEMGMGMSQEILGAGGSTRMARESTMGLQMQRGMNLTNAGQLLGTLSGGLGDVSSSRTAMIKMLAEGSKLGLDDSKFAEENRKFMQATTEIVTRSGARTGEGFDTAVGGFGRFVTEKTTMGLEGAKGAYEQYQNISAQTAGPRGAMQYAAFMKDPNLNKLSVMEKSALAGLRDEEVNVDNPQIIAAALARGMEPADLVASLKKAKGGASTAFGIGDAAATRLRGKVDMSRIQDAGYMRTLTKDQLADISMVQATSTAGEGKLNTRESISRAAARVAGIDMGDGDDEKLIREARKARDLEPLQEEGATGKIEDKTVGNLAENQRLALGAFQSFSKEIVSSVTEVRKLNEALIKASNSLNNIANENDRRSAAGIIENMFGVRPSATQTQSGKGTK